jgi:hypothetical protein
MKKAIGAILSVGGLIGLIYTVMQYMDQSGSVSIAGAEVAESTGPILPIIISGVVLLVGVVILMNSRGE